LYKELAVFVVFVDKPYYPYIAGEFKSQEAAERAALAHRPDPDESGPVNTVYVAEIISKVMSRGW
jgi:hypothetical protein